MKNKISCDLFGKKTGSSLVLISTSENLRVTNLTKSDLCFLYFRIPTSSPLGDPTMASTAALLGLHSRPELPPNHPLSPTYLGLHSSPTSSLRLQLPPSHADYLSAAATAQRLGELQQAAQASIDVPFSLDGKYLQSISLLCFNLMTMHKSIIF